jgi:hypothetical protein
LLKPVKSGARAGWGEKFAAMTKNGDDCLLLPEGIDAGDAGWEWSAV